MHLHRTHPSHLCFNKQMEQIMGYILPANIDKTVFEELGGFFESKTNVDVNINNSEKDNKRYLGTYFPRSWVESFTIMKDIYSHDHLRKSIQEKEQINILDIGTGTGGNIVGMMDYFRCAGFTSENITFYTLEGNLNAIEMQRKIFDSYNLNNSTKFILECSLIRFTSASSLNKQLEDFLIQKELKFDIISSFKFLSEFYNINYKLAKGIYTSFVSTVQDFLTPQGILIMFDLVCGSMDRTNVRPFTTQIMSDELNGYIKLPKSQLNYVLPVCCGKWGYKCKQEQCYIERQFHVHHTRKESDLSKGCYRVMTEKNFAAQIINSLPIDNKYQMSENNWHPMTCKDAILYKKAPGINKENVLNGFNLQ